MAYNEELAVRIRTCLDGLAEIEEKEMFGGVSSLLSGNVSVGVIKGEMMVRVSPDAFEAIVELPGARIMDFTGRPMKGRLIVSGAAIDDNESLAEWVDRGTAFAGSLPKKSPLRES